MEMTTKAGTKLPSIKKWWRALQASLSRLLVTMLTRKRVTAILKGMPKCLYDFLKALLPFILSYIVYSSTVILNKPGLYFSGFISAQLDRGRLPLRIENVGKSPAANVRFKYAFIFDEDNQLVSDCVPFANPIPAGAPDFYAGAPDIPKLSQRPDGAMATLLLRVIYENPSVPRLPFELPLLQRVSEDKYFYRVKLTTHGFNLIDPINPKEFDLIRKHLELFLESKKAWLEDWNQCPTTL